MTEFYSSKVQYCNSSKSGLFQPTKFYYYASERCVGSHVDFRKNFIKQNFHHFSQWKFGIYKTISYLAPKSLYWKRNLVGWYSVISPEFTGVLGSMHCPILRSIANILWKFLISLSTLNLVTFAWKKGWCWRLWCSTERMKDDGFL